MLGGDAAAAAWSLHVPVHAQKLLVGRAAPRRLFQAAELRKELACHGLTDASGCKLVDGEEPEVV